MGNFFKRDSEPYICGECSENIYSCDLGKCVSCEDETFTGEAQYCAECSKIYGRCQFCGNRKWFIKTSLYNINMNKCVGKLRVAGC